ncbi:unnamed protein product [Arctogadus glacialis]
MPNFAGIWKMRSSENFDELLKALGVNAMLRKVAGAAAAKPHVEIRQDGQQFYIKTSTTVRTTEINFTIGEEFCEETVDGRKCKTAVMRLCHVVSRVDKSRREPVFYTVYPLASSRCPNQGSQRRGREEGLVWRPESATAPAVTEARAPACRGVHRREAGGELSGTWLRAPCPGALPSLPVWETENRIHCNQTLVDGDGPRTFWTRELKGEELVLVSARAGGGTSW